MTYLLLSILFSSVVVLIFKFFEKYKVATFQAIVVNYALCFLMGAYFSAQPFQAQILPQNEWFQWAAILGILFITVFNAIGWVAQKVSVSVSMVAAKMSVIIPLLFAVVILGESMNALKLSGILLSLAALYFVVGRNEQVHSSGFSVYLYPLLVFIGSGAIDSIMKYLQVTYLHHVSVDTVLTVVFGMAFIAGLILLLRNVVVYREKILLRNLTGGVLLGLPNYFSMYFLFRTLHQPSFTSTLVFPINNIGIVLLSTLLAAVLFKEKLTGRALLGLLLAILSIAIIAFS